MISQHHASEDYKAASNDKDVYSTYFQVPVKKLGLEIPE